MSRRWRHGPISLHSGGSDPVAIRRRRLAVQRPGRYEPLGLVASGSLKWPSLKGVAEGGVLRHSCRAVVTARFRGSRPDSNARVLGPRDSDGGGSGWERGLLAICGCRPAVRCTLAGHLFGPRESIPAAHALADDRLFVLVRILARRLCLPDRCHTKCGIGGVRQFLRGANDCRCHLCIAAALHTLFRRTFCAAVCPLGAIQEVVAIRSVQVPRWLDHALGLLSYVYLGAAVLFAATGTAFVICRFDPFVAFFRTSGSANMLYFGACVLALGVFVGRPYCRYACPYGAILGLLSKLAKWHVRIPPEDCINCKLCEDVCPYGAIQPPTVEPSASTKTHGRQWLAFLLVLAPVLIAAMAWIGTLLARPLSRLHPEVQLAEQIRLEELGEAESTTDASDAFRATGEPVGELYEAAILQGVRFGQLGGWLGGWVGLVLAAKLIHLSLRRKRADYRTDHSSCVSCGRCFWYCPSEQVRLGLIEDVSVVQLETKEGEAGAES